MKVAELINIDEWAKQVPDRKINACAKYTPRNDMSCKHYDGLRCHSLMMQCAHHEENEQLKKMNKNGGNI